MPMNAIFENLTIGALADAAFTNAKDWWQSPLGPAVASAATGRRHWLVFDSSNRRNDSDLVWMRSPSYCGLMTGLTATTRGRLPRENFKI